MTDRLIIDQLGYRYRIEGNEDRIRFQRLDVPVEAAVALTRVQAAVLHACLERADRQGAGHFPVETVDDLVVTLNHNPTMMVIIQGATHIEIHPPGWLPIASEIALLLPRMCLNDENNRQLNATRSPGTMH